MDLKTRNRMIEIKQELANELKTAKDQLEQSLTQKKKDLYQINLSIENLLIQSN